MTNRASEACREASGRPDESSSSGLIGQCNSSAAAPPLPLRVTCHGDDGTTGLKKPHQPRPEQLTTLNYVWFAVDKVSSLLRLC